MATAELKYNPYLQKTEVKFNKKKPRINSLVEKYQKEKLQSWIKKVPAVFHDEMNGYNFELVFYGTKLDYQELKKVFDEAGLLEKNQVRLTHHKPELEERAAKMKLLDELLVWLKAHENSHFDMAAFLEDNINLLNETYSLKVIYGSMFNTSGVDSDDIQVEEVSVVNELDDTDLINTPLLICVTRESLSKLQETIRYFKEREDVKPEQVFFYLHPSIDAMNTERILSDLGIIRPQIVGGVRDEQIRKYIEIFPLTDHISTLLSLFREQAVAIEAALQTEEEKGEKTNALTYQKLQELETVLTRLKITKEAFEKREDFGLPDSWQGIRENLFAGIRNWKKNKTVIKKEQEAEKQADEFNTVIHNLFKKYENDFADALSHEKAAIEEHMRKVYECAEFDNGFQVDLAGIFEVQTEVLPSFITELMGLKEEKYVHPRDDFDIVGLLFKHDPQDPVLETSYYYKSWREYILEAIAPAADRVMERNYASIRAFNNELTELYREHLQELCDTKIGELQESAASLSADEQKLQADRAWLREVEEKLTAIEQG